MRDVQLQIPDHAVIEYLRKLIDQIASGHARLEMWEEDRGETREFSFPVGDGCMTRTFVRPEYYYRLEITTTEEERVITRW